MAGSIETAQRAIAELALAIVELARSEPGSPGVMAAQMFHTELLAVLDRAIGFDKASMHVSRASGELEHGCTYGYERPERFNELPRYMAEFQPSEIADASCGRPIVDIEALSNQRRDQLAIYREVLRPERIRVYTTSIWRCDDNVFGLTLGRTGPAARFGAAELDALTALLPTIKLALAYQTQRARATQSPLAAWGASIGLSPGQQAIAALVVRGLANPEIAEVLGLSANTVRNQLAVVFRKAGASSRAELVFLAMTHGERAETAELTWMRSIR